MILLFLLATCIVLGVLYLIVPSSALYVFYEPSKCKPLLKKYSGDREIQILRALSDGTIKFSDIRHYYNYGVSGTLSWTRQEYLLLKNIADNCPCTIITKHSGSDRSTLHKIDLEIRKGTAVITKHWFAN